ncbi:MAG TPA: hypothetical protein VMY42_03655 [Thermoguttaceae bacterium]|nr:hypothetical protein [Thermoguttaceae bacterium]
MKGTERLTDEQKAPQLRVVRIEDEEAKVDYQPDGRGKAKQDEVEQFWAGRNLAMRRSARVAA